MRSFVATTVLMASALTASANPMNPNEKRDIRGALPAKASDLENEFQPVTDFDTDGCYYTSAIDDQGKTNPGLGPIIKCPASDCRNPDRLENSNVYSRSRCNNGWCAIMYEYYFEKDQTVCGTYGVGHRHDWENIIVFVKDGEVKRVAPSCHGKYEHARNAPDARFEGKRAKIVYHQDGAGTHCFRHANEEDDGIENYTGKWYEGRLIGWNDWPTAELKQKMLDAWSGGVGPKLPDDKFTNTLKAAAGDQVPGFDPAKDE